VCGKSVVEGALSGMAGIPYNNDGPGIKLSRGGRRGGATKTNGNPFSEFIFHSLAI